MSLMPEPWAGRAGICFPGKRTGAGRLELGFLSACLVGRCWANRRQEQGGWSQVSPQQESLLCPADHDVLLPAVQKGLGSREDFKCIQCFPSPGSWLGLCNTMAAATGGSEHGRMRFEENRACSDVSGSSRSAVCRRSLQHLGSLCPRELLLTPSWLAVLGPRQPPVLWLWGMVLAPLQSGGSLPMPGSGTTHGGWCQQAKEAMPVSLAVGWLFLLPVFTS